MKEIGKTPPPSNSIRQNPADSEKGKDSSSVGHRTQSPGSVSSHSSFAELFEKALGAE